MVVLVILKYAEVTLFWFCLWKRFKNRIDHLEYAYLKSNHSNNPSDTGASHGKQQVKYYNVANKRNVPSDEFEVASVISTRKNHQADVISVYSQVNGVKVRPLNQ